VRRLAFLSQGEGKNFPRRRRARSPPLWWVRPDFCRGKGEKKKKKEEVPKELTPLIPYPDPRSAKKVKGRGHTDIASVPKKRRRETSPSAAGKERKKAIHGEKGPGCPASLSRTLRYEGKEREGDDGRVRIIDRGGEIGGKKGGGLPFERKRTTITAAKKKKKKGKRNLLCPLPLAAAIRQRGKQKLEEKENRGLSWPSRRPRSRERGGEKRSVSCVRRCSRQKKGGLEGKKEQHGRRRRPFSRPDGGGKRRRPLATYLLPEPLRRVAQA